MINHVTRRTALALSLGLGLSASGILMQAAQNAFHPTEFLVYIGTYTTGKSKGIYVSHLDLATGKLSAPELAVETTSPSFVTLHPSGKYLYAANEISNYGGKPAGAISAFSIDHATGKLKLLSQQSSGGKDPCFVTVDLSGQCVLAANYSSGSVCVLPIQPDGSIREASELIQHIGSSVDPQRQKEPHAHSINVSPDNRFAFAADLGLDKILLYKLDPAKGKLTPNDPAFTSVPPGGGPRHLAFHPNKKYAYVINEMKLTVTVLSYNASQGSFTVIQNEDTVPGGPKPGYSGAEVQVHPSGDFLYASNRGHDSITAFKVDGVSGKLTFIENRPSIGKVPRNFGIDPTGQYLIAANQNSDNVVVFKIDQGTGKLTETGSQITVGAPVCVKFLLP